MAILNWLYAAAFAALFPLLWLLLARRLDRIWPSNWEREHPGVPEGQTERQFWLAHEEWLALLEGGRSEPQQLADLQEATPAKPPSVRSHQAP
jgi:hypothetical protein